MSNNDNDKQKTNHLSDQDRALLREFYQSVTPLKSTNRVTPKPNASKVIKNNPHTKYFQKRRDDDAHEDQRKNHPYDLNTIEPVAPDATLQYSRPHLHRNLHKRMKRGTIPFEAALDLHECTANTALCKTQKFLQKCLDENVRWVLIIHGKGNLSQNRIPVLKSVLNGWLRTQPAVLAFHSAQPKDGGTGALYVLLKLKKG